VRCGSEGVTKMTKGYRDCTDFKHRSSVNAPGRYDSFVNNVTYAALLDIVVMHQGVESNFKFRNLQLSQSPYPSHGINHRELAIKCTNLGSPAQRT